MNVPDGFVVVEDETIEKLEQDDTGFWLVNGPRTSHLWFMDHPQGMPVYLRVPGEHSQKLDIVSNRKQVLLVLEWPQVGRVFNVWFSDGTRLQSSMVESIVRVKPKDGA